MINFIFAHLISAASQKLAAYRGCLTFIVAVGVFILVLLAVR